MLEWKLIKKMQNNNLFNLEINQNNNKKFN